jgi:D-sedoheptulose 7-phosphate isomerase
VPTKLNDQGFIAKFLDEFCRVGPRISRSEIEQVVEILYEAWENGRTVFIVGNGGSASTATHFACDLAKGTIVEGKRRFRVVSLTDNVPLITALTNDNGFNMIFVEQLKNLLQSGDVVIAISVHGGSGEDKAGPWSQNLTAAIQYAKDNASKTIGIAGFDGGAFKELADACIVVPAESTPYVESWHVTLEHLICSCLKERIEQT